MDRQSRGPTRGGFSLSEQPPGPHDEHGRHHQEHQDNRDLRKDQDAERVQLGDQHRGDEGTDDAAKTSDHDHDEDIDDDAQVHGVMHRIARNLQRAAEGREKDAKREDAGKQPFLINTERCHHVAVLRRRTDQGAPSRALKQQPQTAEDNRPERDQDQVITWNLLAEDIHRAPEAGCTPAEQVARPPDQHHEVLDHQGQAERGEQLKQLRRMIDPSQQQRLDQDTNESDNQRRRHDAAPETKGTRKPFGQGERNISAKHIEGAMREIHDARDAENDRQTGGDQKQRGCTRQPGQELNEIKGHGDPLARAPCDMRLSAVIARSEATKPSSSVGREFVWIASLLSQ